MDTKIKKRINGENKFRKYNNGVLTYKFRKPGKINKE